MQQIEQRDDVIALSNSNNLVYLKYDKKLEIITSQNTLNKYESFNKYESLNQDNINNFNKFNFKDVDTNVYTLKCFAD
jgi:hypothetical protein